MLFSRHFDNWLREKGGILDRINKIYRIGRQMGSRQEEHDGHE
jgi:hypothetical protein